MSVKKKGNYIYFYLICQAFWQIFAVFFKVFP